MKTYFILAALFFYILCSGCSTESTKNQSGNSISQTQCNSLDDSIYQILLDYLKYHNFDERIVYQLFLDQNADSSTLYLSFTEYYDEIFVFMPTGFFKINRQLVLLYSPSQFIYKSDNHFKQKLMIEINKISLKKKENAPSIREHKSWYISKKRGISIIQKGEINISPYSSVGIELSKFRAIN
jgi:hypothetical protein